MKSTFSLCMSEFSPCSPASTHSLKTTPLTTCKMRGGGKKGFEALFRGQIFTSTKTTTRWKNNSASLVTKGVATIAAVAMAERQRLH